MKNLSSFRRLLPVGSLFLIVMVVGSACKITGNDYSDITDLDVQKGIWDAANSGNYSYTLQRGCFCVYGGPFEIRIKDNRIVEVLSGLDDTPVVPVKDYGLFWTIDELFELIRDAQTGEADKITVEYSAEGYPTSIDIDYIKMAIDDELFLKVENLKME